MSATAKEKLDANSGRVAATIRGSRFATFVAEPLQPGFGLTLGNSLRRVLLSSLQGAAIKAVKIAGVTHEFSTLPGVREELGDVISNLRQIALGIERPGERRLRLVCKGPAEVTAGDIKVPEDTKIINPDAVICHLEHGAELKMDILVGTGKGYVPAISNVSSAAPVGTIPLDALYSPVRSVSYKVECIEIEKEERYDKLTISVETNGSVSATDAMSYAALIFSDQLELFASASSEGRNDGDRKDVRSESWTTFVPNGAISASVISESSTDSTKDDQPQREGGPGADGDRGERRSWRNAEIFAKAMSILGSQEEAEQWLRTRAIGLNDYTPEELLKTEEGQLIVDEYLDRMAYGIYA